VPRPKNTLHKSLVNRNIIIAAIIAVVAGACMAAIGVLLSDYSWCPKVVAELTKEVGTAVFSIGILALIWELAARREFMHEIMATVDLSDDIEEHGLQRITFEYLQGVPWPELFRNTDTFDIYVSYARTWTKANAVHLNEMADRGVAVRVLLPNPDDDRVTAELAVWYLTNATELRERVRGAVRHFTELADRPKAKVEVRLTNSCPLFTTYFFSRSAVFTTHSHRPAPAPVPTFIAEVGKPLYDFFKVEFNHLWDGATPVPNTKPATEALI
jgi:hypothetical protein